MTIYRVRLKLTDENCNFSKTAYKIICRVVCITTENYIKILLICDSV